MISPVISRNSGNPRSACQELIFLSSNNLIIASEQSPKKLSNNKSGDFRKTAI
jgi:hypothetical protein